MSSGNWRAIVNSFSLQRIAFTCAKIREFGNNLRKQRVKFSNFDLKRRNLWNVSHLLIQARLKKWKILGFCRFFPSLQNFFEHDSFLIIHPSCPPPLYPKFAYFHFDSVSTFFTLPSKCYSKPEKLHSQFNNGLKYLILPTFIVKGKGVGVDAHVCSFSNVEKMKIGLIIKSSFFGSNELESTKSTENDSWIAVTKSQSDGGGKNVIQ